MKTIMQNTSLKEFKPTAKAANTKATILKHGKEKEFKRIIDKLYPDGIDEESLDDLLRYDKLWIYKHLCIDPNDEAEEKTTYGVIRKDFYMPEVDWDILADESIKQVSEKIIADEVEFSILKAREIGGIRAGKVNVVFRQTESGDLTHVLFEMVYSDYFRFLRSPLYLKQILMDKNFRVIDEDKDKLYDIKRICFC